MAVKKDTTDYSKIESKISPVAELEPYLSALVYGRSGTGKTNFAGTFPKPLLLLDIKEKGTDTIAKVPGIDVISVTDWSEFEQIYWYLKEGKHEYVSVIVDGASQLQDLGMDEILESPGDIMSKRDWGALSGMLKTWLFNYRDLCERKMHVLVIAHERENEGGDSVEDQIDPTIGPRFMPSVAAAVNGAFSFIGSTFIREKFIGKGDDKVRQVEYGMRVGPHAYYTTKIRKPPESSAMDVIINPTFEKVMAASRGELTAPKRSIRRKNAQAKTEE